MDRRSHEMRTCNILTPNALRHQDSRAYGVYILHMPCQCHATVPVVVQDAEQLGSGVAAPEPLEQGCEGRSFQSCDRLKQLRGLAPDARRAPGPEPRNREATRHLLNSQSPPSVPDEAT